MPPMADNLVAELDSLRTDLLLCCAPGSALAGEEAIRALVGRLCDCTAHMRGVSQDVALQAAKEVALRPSDLMPLLRRAVIVDPDERMGLAAATSELVNILSGSGEHTFQFCTSAVSLKVRYRPQDTGTHGRIWRSEHIVARACEEGWGGISIRSKCIVELACGTAAAGLVCAALGAQAVHLTDVDEGSLSLARANAELNGLQDVVQVQRLDVMKLGASPLPSTARVDLFLASDIPYDFVDAELFVESLEAMLRSELAAEGAMALVVQDCDPRRSETHQAGIQRCVELAGKHPRLQCLREERKRAATTADDDDEMQTEVIMHLYSARASDAKCSPAD